MAKRGRPKGSTYPDGPYLDQIADALTRNSAKSANAAIMQIAKSEDVPQQGLEAFRRRLHDKWSAQKEERLAEARERQAERNRPARRVVDRRSTMEGYMGEALRATKAFQESPAMRAIQDFERSGVGAALRQIENSGVGMVMRDLERSGIGRAIQDMERSNLHSVLKNLDNHNIFKILDN